MEPIKFDECNVIFAEDQKEYNPLPAHKSDQGIVTSCWKMTWKERVKVFFVGKVYLQLFTFNSPLQPQRIVVHNPFK